MMVLPRPVTKMNCSAPAAAASSSAYWMIGRSTTGSISLGNTLVAGSIRVPRPATGNTTLRTLAMRSTSFQFGARGTYGGCACSRPHGDSSTAAVPQGRSAGSAQQMVAGAIELGGQVRAAAMVRVQARHQLAMRRLDLGLPGTGCQAQDLQCRALVHSTAGRLRRCRRLGMPIGEAALEIGLQQGRRRRILPSCLVEQPQQIAQPQPAQLAPGQRTSLDPALDLAGAMVQAHGQQVGLDA